MADQDPTIEILRICHQHDFVGLTHLIDSLTDVEVKYAISHLSGIAAAMVATVADQAGITFDEMLDEYRDHLADREDDDGF